MSTTQNQTEPTKSKSMEQRKNQVPGFLAKTYSILENKKYSGVISWTEDGKGFIIKDIQSMERYILPAYFKHNNLTSFTRLLNMYDFKKTKLRNKAKLLTHEYFQRGREDLIRLIKRRKSNSKSPGGVPKEEWQTVFNSFLNSKLNKEGGKLSSKFEIMGNLLENYGDQWLKNGVSKVLEVLTKVVSQGENSLSKSEKIKLQLCKNMFKMFGIIDSNMEPEPKRNNKREKLGGQMVEDCCTDQSDVEEIDLLGKRAFDNGFKPIENSAVCGNFDHQIQKLKGVGERGPVE